MMELKPRPGFEGRIQDLAALLLIRARVNRLFTFDPLEEGFVKMPMVASCGAARYLVGNDTILIG